MPFDLKKFEQAQFMQRTKQIEVPLLQDFFAEGDEAVWTIRALSSEDLALVSLSQERNKAMGTLLTAMLGAASNDKADAIRKLVGINRDELPDDLVRRIEVLLLGSVDLEADNPQHREVVIKIAQFYPGTFMRLTNEIYSLSGEGPDIEGKP